MTHKTKKTEDRPVGSVIQRGPSWVLVYQVKTINPATRELEQHRKNHKLASISELTYEQARAMADEFLGEQSRTISASSTIRQYYDGVYDAHLNRFKHSTQMQWRSMLKRHVLPDYEFGNRRFADIRRQEVEAWFRRKAATPIQIGKKKVTTRPGLSYKSQFLLRTTFSCMFEHAIQRGICIVNPVAGADLGSKPAAIMPLYHLTVQEATTLVEALGTPARELVQLGIALALGEAELLGLAWGCINWTDEPQTLLIRPVITEPQEERITLRPRSIRILQNFFKGKFGSTKAAARSRTLPLPPVLCELFRELWKSAQWREPNDLVFVGSQRGLPLGSGNLLKRKIKRATQRLGFDYTFHVGRRTFASISEISGKFTSAERRKVLGHGDKSMTDHYTHTDWEHLTAAMEDYVNQFGWTTVAATPINHPEITPINHPQEPVPEHHGAGVQHHETTSIQI